MLKKIAIPAIMALLLLLTFSCTKPGVGGLDETIEGSLQEGMNTEPGTDSSFESALLPEGDLTDTGEKKSETEDGAGEEAQKEIYPVVRSDCESITEKSDCLKSVTENEKCQWFEDACISIPEWCPVVNWDENKNIIVDGKPFFPIGLWGFYSETVESLKNNNLQKYFNMVIGTQKFLADYVNDPDVEGSVKLFGQYAVIGSGDSIVPYKMALDYLLQNKNLIFWELFPESEKMPKRYEDGVWIYDSPNADVPLQAETIKANDPCKRPVVLTPGAAVLGYPWLDYHSQFADIIIMQTGFRTPKLDIKSVGGKYFQKGLDTIGDKIPVFLMGTEGYQPERLRYGQREPDRDESRVQMYDMIVHGAKGITVYPKAAGTGDYKRIEVPDAMYNIDDSPNHFKDLKDIGLDLKKHTNIFVSPVSESSSVLRSPEDINCNVWDVKEGKKTVKYAICTNVGQITSPYFKYVVGDYAYLIKGHLMLGEKVEGEVYPPFQCSNGVSDDLDGRVDLDDPDCTSWDDDSEDYNETMNKIVYDRDMPLSTSKIYHTWIYTGITWDRKTVDHFSLEFVKIPEGGAEFDWAIYSDGDPNYVNNNPDRDKHFDINRDTAPDFLILKGTAAVKTAGFHIFSLPQPVVLDHTRFYALVVRPKSEGIVLRGKDYRSAPVPLENSAGFLDLREQAPPLFQGKEIAGPVSFSNVSSRYCVHKTIDDQASFGTLTDGAINEVFAPYAVHIYKFGDFLGKEEICGDGVDNNCDGVIDCESR